MPGIVKVPFQDKLVEAIEIDFVPGKEPWAEYDLMDGGKVKIRTTISRIFWLVDAEGVPMRDVEGQACLFVSHQEQIVVQV